MRALSQLTTNPFEVKLTDRSQSSKEGAVSPPLLVLGDESRLRESLGREQISDRVRKPTPLASPTSSLADIQLREAVTPQFLVQTSSPPETTPPLPRIPEEWKKEWLALPAHRLTHTESVGVRSPPQGSSRSWKTDTLHLGDPAPSDKSSLHDDFAPKPSIPPILSPTESLSSRHNLSIRSPELPIEESKQSTQKSLDLKIMTGSVRTEEGLTSLLDEAKESQYMSSRYILRDESQEGLVEDLHPKLESAEILADKIAEIHSKSMFSSLFFALQSIKNCVLLSDFDISEDSKYFDIDPNYADFLKKSLFKTLQKLTFQAQIAQEIKFRVHERQLHHWFHNYHRLFQAHQMWLREVKNEFLNRRLQGMVAGWRKYTQYRRLRVEVMERRYRRLLVRVMEDWRQKVDVGKVKSMRAYVFWYRKLTVKALSGWFENHHNREKTTRARNYYKASMMLKYFFRWRSELQRPTHDYIPLRITRETTVSRRGEQLLKRKTVEVKVINL